MYVKDQETSVKGQIATILDFVSQMISVAVPQLCYSRMKAAIDDM